MRRVYRPARTVHDGKRNRYTSLYESGGSLSQILTIEDIRQLL
jgi:hypothetical protein